MIVTDASFVMALLLSELPRSDAARERLSGIDESLHAPELLDVEVLSVLRRLHRGGTMTRSGAEASIHALRRMRLVRYPHRMLLGRSWALRDNLSAYDAIYVALAESLGATLLTLDHAMARAPSPARVELVG